MAWNAKDQKQLEELLRKAHSQGLSLSQLGLPQIGATSSEFDSEFSFVEPTGGTMADSCKRRDEGTDENPFTKKSALSLDALDSVEGGGYTFKSLEKEFGSSPLTHREVVNTMDSTELPSLPAGVPDVATWGKTLIKFGQFGKQNMTYYELASSSESRCQGYTKWCKDHGKGAKGHLRDLVDYLSHYDAAHGVSQAPIIPGTSMKREFKA